MFGLSDAPREWYLRLHRCLTDHGWIRGWIDQATWLLFGEDGSLEGILVGHVDDLLVGGSEYAMQKLDRIGEELGFGSL